MMRTCAWLRLALYSSNQKYKKNARGVFWGGGAGRVRPALSKLKTLTYASLLYCTFELRYSCTQQPGKGPHCAETDRSAGSETCIKTEIFDLQRPATDSEELQRTQTICRFVSQMLQNFHNIRPRTLCCSPVSVQSVQCGPDLNKEGPAGQTKFHLFSLKWKQNRISL